MAGPLHEGARYLLNRGEVTSSRSRTAVARCTPHLAGGPARIIASTSSMSPMPAARSPSGSPGCTIQSPAIGASTSAASGSALRPDGRPMCQCRGFTVSATIGLATGARHVDTDRLCADECAATGHMPTSRMTASNEQSGRSHRSAGVDGSAQCNNMCGTLDQLGVLISDDMIHEKSHEGAPTAAHSARTGVIRTPLLF